MFTDVSYKATIDCSRLDCNFSNGGLQEIKTPPESYKLTFIYVQIIPKYNGLHYI